MPDPFADVPHLDAAGLASLSDTCPDLLEFDDVPACDHGADPEVDPYVRLDGDRAHVRTPTRRLFHDYRANPHAYRHLDHLPGPGQSLHGVISGRYALWDLVPAR